MVTGHPPFMLPSGTDPFYKYIASNYIGDFFKRHIKHSGDKDFSEEFMNLFSTLVLPNSFLRLSLAEIMQHPWVQGEVATE